MVVLWPSGANRGAVASMLETLLVAGLIGAPFQLGALLVGVRTRPSRWARAGLAIALAATGLLALAWAALLLLSLALSG